jgi:cell division protein FtsQ
MTPNTRQPEQTKSEQIARRVLSNTRTPAPKKRWAVVGRAMVGMSRRLAWGAVAGVLLVGGAYGVGQAWEAAKESQYFTIADITIAGNHKLTRDEILAVTRLDVAQNLLRYDVTVAASSLLALPYVAKAEVTRELPDRLLITITEREPLAIIALGSLYLVDEQGVLFKRLEASDNADLPVVTGLSRDLLNERGTSPELMSAVHAVQSLQRLQAFARFEIGEIFIRADLSVGLVLGSRGLRVLLGDIEEDGAGLAERLERLARVLAVAKEQKMDPQEIALDNVTRPERVAVKLHQSNQ